MEHYYCYDDVCGTLVLQNQMIAVFPFKNNAA